MGAHLAHSQHRVARTRIDHEQAGPGFAGHRNGAEIEHLDLEQIASRIVDHREFGGALVRGAERDPHQRPVRIITGDQQGTLVHRSIDLGVTHGQQEISTRFEHLVQVANRIHHEFIAGAAFQAQGEQGQVTVTRIADGQFHGDRFTDPGVAEVDRFHADLDDRLTRILIRVAFITAVQTAVRVCIDTKLIDAYLTQQDTIRIVCAGGPPISGRCAKAVGTTLAHRAIIINCANDHTTIVRTAGSATGSEHDTAQQRGNNDRNDFFAHVSTPNPAGCTNSWRFTGGP